MVDYDRDEQDTPIDDEDERIFAIGNHACDSGEEHGLEGAEPEPEGVDSAGEEEGSGELPEDEGDGGLASLFGLNSDEEEVQLPGDPPLVSMMSADSQEPAAESAEPSGDPLEEILGDHFEGQEEGLVSDDGPGVEDALGTDEDWEGLPDEQPSEPPSDAHEGLEALESPALDVFDGWELGSEEDTFALIEEDVESPAPSVAQHFAAETDFRVGPEGEAQDDLGVEPVMDQAPEEVEPEPEETRGEVSQAAGVDHGFQLSGDLEEFPLEEKLETQSLGEVVNESDSLVDHGFSLDSLPSSGSELEQEQALEPEGDGPEQESHTEEVDLSETAGFGAPQEEDKEYVSWADGGEEAQDPELAPGTGAEDQPDFRDPHALEATGEDVAAAAGDGYLDEDQLDELLDEEEAAAEEHEGQEERSGSLRKLFLLGSGVMAACLIGMLALMQKTHEEQVPTPPRKAQAPVKTPQKGALGAAIASGGGAKEAPPAEEGPTPDKPTGESGEAGKAGGESSPTSPPAGEAPAQPSGTDQQPGSVAAGGAGEKAQPPAVEVGGEKPGESVPIQPGEGEVAKAADLIPTPLDAGEVEAPPVEEPEGFDPREPIPEASWSSLAKGLSGSGLLRRQSKVRVLLRNGNEFSGQLRKLNEEYIELSVEFGEITFHHEDLSQVFPLEAAAHRVSGYPEGYVEFTNHSKLWGRIIEDLPSQVTLGFGAARITIPKRAVRAVKLQAMSTIDLRGEGGAQ